MRLEMLTRTSLVERSNNLGRYDRYVELKIPDTSTLYHPLRYQQVDEVRIVRYHWGDCCHLPDNGLILYRKVQSWSSHQPPGVVC